MSLRSWSDAHGWLLVGTHPWIDTRASRLPVHIGIILHRRILDLDYPLLQAAECTWRGQAVLLLPSPAALPTGVQLDLYSSPSSIHGSPRRSRGTHTVTTPAQLPSGSAAV